MSDARAAAIVTGAASGIGRALALEAATRGMQLAIADVDAAGLADTERLLAMSGCPVFAAKVDIRDAAAVAGFAQACFARYASIALACANAGVMAFGSTASPDIAAWDRMIDVNLRGTVHTVAAFAGELVARAAPSRILITGSQTAFAVSSGLGGYASTKHALWGIADSLRAELAGTAVTVSFLAPPAVLTGMAEPTIARLRARSGEAAVDAFLRVAWTPEDVARAALDAAERGEYLIVPGNMIADAIAERVRPLLAA